MLRLSQTIIIVFLEQVIKVGKRNIKKKGIQNVILFWLLILSFSSCALLTLYTVQVQYRNFKAEAKFTRERYINDQKNTLKQRVEEAVAYAHFQSKRVHSRLEAYLQSRTYEAWDVANHLYIKNKNTKSPEEIAQLIKDALRPIRFNQGRGYYFIVSFDGVEELYPTRPELEGKNLINLQDIKGQFVIQNEISTVKEKGEGFVKGYWPNPQIPNDPGSLEYSFVKSFSPMNWLIGTGEFLDNVEQDMKNETLAWLAKIRYGNGSYIFADTYRGDALLMDGKIVTEKINVWDLEDPNGIKVIQEETRIAKSNEAGGFLSYSWKRENGTHPVPVISYVKAMQEWDWVIGSSIYMDDIENAILLQQKRLKTNVIKDIRLILFGFLFFLPVVTVVSVFISRAFKRELNVFVSFFSDTNQSFNKIDLSSLHIQEFFNLGSATNKMLQRWQQAEQRLLLLSRTDPLTGLANRREMIDKINTETKRMKRTGDTFSFVLADIDHFKQINDNFGHDAGDATLKMVAQIFQHSARENDTIARWGGEEFLLLLPNTHLEGAATVAEKLQKRIEQEIFAYNDLEIKITITCGVSSCKRGMDYKEAITVADSCLYTGKQEGRNTIIVAGQKRTR